MSKKVGSKPWKSKCNIVPSKKRGRDAEHHALTAVGSGQDAPASSGECIGLVVQSGGE